MFGLAFCSSWKLNCIQNNQIKRPCFLFSFHRFKLFLNEKRMKYHFKKCQDKPVFLLCTMCFSIFYKFSTIRSAHSLLLVLWNQKWKLTDPDSFKNVLGFLNSSEVQVWISEIAAADTRFCILYFGLAKSPAVFRFCFFLPQAPLASLYLNSSFLPF